MTSRLIEIREPTDAEWGRAGGEVVFIRADVQGQCHIIHARRMDDGSYQQWGVCAPLLGDNVDDVSRWAEHPVPCRHGKYNIVAQARRWIENTRQEAALVKAQIGSPDCQVLDSEEALRRLRAYQYGYQVGMENATKDVEAMLNNNWE